MLAKLRPVGSFLDTLTITTNGNDTTVCLSGVGTLAVSIDEVINKDAIRLYPNPTSGVLNIEVYPKVQRNIAVSVIDNLCRGASGLSIACMNLMEGWPEEMGLQQAPLFP